MKLRRITQSLRQFRVWHKYAGVALAVLVILSALTGILLALKKEVTVLQPPTQKGQAQELNAWLPLEILAEKATTALCEAQPNQQGNAIDRMDVRPGKSIVKVLFEKGYWEVQLDGSTGQVLSVAQRHSDWIEQVHDGSIISDWFKLGAMHVLGLGLLLMTVTGLWLWYGPKQYRKLKRQSK